MNSIGDVLVSDSEMNETSNYLFVASCIWKKFVISRSEMTVILYECVYYLTRDMRSEVYFALVR